jgi:hypothetical protein
MGQKLCGQKPQHDEPASYQPSVPSRQRAPASAGAAYRDPTPDAAAVSPPPARPTISGAGCDASHAPLLDDATLELVAAGMPYAMRSNWCLVYSSTQHGKNFTRLTTALTDGRARGATLIVIKEAGGRVLGGFNSCAWSTLGEREQAGKSNAAARHRAERDHCNKDSYTSRPEQQAMQFMGDEDCFVFTDGGAGGAPRVFKPKHNAAANANYMFLYDRHPIADRAGIGMGSSELKGIGEFAWFMDKYLSRGKCSVRLGPTFGNPRLSDESEFSIATVEAYAVDPAAVERLAADGGAPMVRRKPGEGPDDQSILDRKEDMAMLGFNGHKFYSQESEREDVGGGCCGKPGQHAQASEASGREEIGTFMGVKPQQ